MKLKLGYQTNDYQIVFDGTSFLQDLDPQIKTSAERYLSANQQVITKNKYNIWFDHKNNLCFSQAQYHGTAIGKDHHFWTSKDDFIYNHKFSWDKRFKDYYIPYQRKGKKFLFNYNLGFEANDALLNLRGKSVTIVCGGPSSNDVAWEKLNTDFIWTCNQFYKNKKFENTKADLVVTHAEVVDINKDKNFLDYIKKFKPLVSFEVDQGDNRGQYDEIKKFCQTTDHNVNFFHTRYRGQPGLGLRMLIYAVYMGFKNIHVVGLDGRTKSETDGKLMHAFDGNKNVPNWYKRYGDDFQDRQFVVFWDYIQSLKLDGYDFTIHNLGEGKEYNVLSKLFSKTFPLSNKIKEAVRYEN